jgi:hypothetical protein
VPDSENLPIIWIKYSQLNLQDIAILGLGLSEISPERNYGSDVMLNTQRLGMLGTQDPPHSHQDITKFGLGVSILAAL